VTGKILADVLVVAYFVVFSAASELVTEPFFRSDIFADILERALLPTKLAIALPILIIGVPDTSLRADPFASAAIALVAAGKEGEAQ